jgi:hypothetical protein
LSESYASSNRLKGAALRAEAVRLRLTGLTYRAIGERLGFSEQRAWKIITGELARLTAERREAAAALLELSLERLDAMLLAAWDRAAGGNLRAIDRVLKTVEKQTRLLGVQPPRRTELSGPGGGAVRVVRIEAVPPPGLPAEEAPTGTGFADGG